MKLCKDCKQYQKGVIGQPTWRNDEPFWSAPKHQCWTHISLIDGGRECRNAETERKNPTTCGPEGKLWEAKR